MVGRRGGIERLGRLVDYRWEELEASFRAVYHLNLAEELWRNRMSLREFGVLVNNLPRDCALHRLEGWTFTEQLLAFQASELRHMHRMLMLTVPWKKGRQPKLPDPLDLKLPTVKKQRKSWIRDWAQKATGRG